MKKLMALCLALTMVMGAALCVSADSAVPSPSGNNGPKVIIAKVDDTDITPDVKVTPYADRASAPDDVRDNLEAAYAQISGAENVADLNESLKELAKSMDLSVSDLFDLRDSSAARQGAKMSITMSSNTFENFVALMYYDNGAWKLVEDASVTQIGTDYYLAFTSLGAYPYAVLVGTEKEIEAIYGDANDDGAVNMKDVLLMRKYIAELTDEINLVNADVNVDGSVNMKDVLAVRKFVAELIDHLGPEA